MIEDLKEELEMVKEECEGRLNERSRTSKIYRKLEKEVSKTREVSRLKEEHH
jgi:hypothetical protein